MLAKRFRIIITDPAKRDLSCLEPGVSLQIFRDIDSYLRIYPIPIGKPRLKKLEGYDPPLYRMRSGDFRLYYRIKADAVIILAVRPKKDSEKFLRRIEEARSAYDTFSQGTSLRLATRPWHVTTGEYGGSRSPGEARGPGAVEKERRKDLSQTSFSKKERPIKKGKSGKP